MTCMLVLFFLVVNLKSIPYHPCGKITHPLGRISKLTSSTTGEFTRRRNTCVLVDIVRKALFSLCVRVCPPLDMGKIDAEDLPRGCSIFLFCVLSQGVCHLLILSVISGCVCCLLIFGVVRKVLCSENSYEFSPRNGLVTGGSPVYLGA